jgi:hypothetical protein
MIFEPLNPCFRPECRKLTFVLAAEYTASSDLFQELSPGAPTCSDGRRAALVGGSPENLRTGYALLVLDWN